MAVATLPCGRPAAFPGQPARATTTAEPGQSPVLSVLDLETGRRRDWSTPPASVLGSIVWAGDSRTLGYSVGDLRALRDVTAYALDTDRPGADARAGRVLLRPSDYDGDLTTVLMDLDGRGGYGTLDAASPPSTVVFTFTEGRPIHVLSTIVKKPDVLSAVSVSVGGGQPRYACAGGIDAFGRVMNGYVALSGSGFSRCTSTTDVPY